MTKHTVSLKLAKQMKKLGFKKETLFYWARPGNKEKFELKIKQSLTSLIHKEDDSWPWLVEALDHGDAYPAPISDEILEELPRKIINHSGLSSEETGGYKIHFDLLLRFWYTPNGQPSVSYVGKRTSEYPIFTEQASTPAEALGEMYCYLKENKLIK